MASGTKKKKKKQSCQLTCDRAPAKNKSWFPFSCCHRPLVSPYDVRRLSGPVISAATVLSRPNFCWEFRSQCGKLPGLREREREIYLGGQRILQIVAVKDTKLRHPRDLELSIRASNSYTDLHIICHIVSRRLTRLAGELLPHMSRELAHQLTLTYSSQQT